MTPYSPSWINCLMFLFFASFSGLPLRFLFQPCRDRAAAERGQFVSKSISPESIHRALCPFLFFSVSFFPSQVFFRFPLLQRTYTTRDFEACVCPLGKLLLFSWVPPPLYDRFLPFFLRFSPFSTLIGPVHE